KTAQENQVDGNFLSSSLGDPTDGVNYPDAPARLTKAISQGIAFKPHLVLVSTGPGLAATTVVPYDTQWVVGTSGPKPLFVSVQQSWPNNIVGAIGNRDALRKRYYGLEQIAPNFDQARFTTF